MTKRQFEDWVESVGGVGFAAKTLGITERHILNYCYGHAIPLTVELATKWITSQGMRSKVIDYMPAHGKRVPGRFGDRTRPIYPKL